MATNSTVDLTIFRCPITREPLEFVAADRLAELNRSIESGSLSHFSGETVRLPLESALVNRSRQFIYPVRDGVYLLLPGFAIRDPATADTADATSDVELRAEKEVVRQFYDDVGWKKDEVGTYEDTNRFVDTRPVSQEYLEKCHARLKQYLPGTGRYFLDVASGPIAHDSHLAYSDGFGKRVCVDLSLRALLEAKAKLGERGLYIVGDLTNLPLADDTIDAAVSLHTIYHIPADEQRTAFDELHRVITPTGKAVVVYTFGTASPLVRVASIPRHVARRVGRLLSAAKSVSGKRPSGLYYHPHPYSWFRNQQWSYPIDILCWRSIGKATLEDWFHPHFMGKTLLRLLYSAESAMPKLLGRLGQYPLIVVRK